MFQINSSFFNRSFNDRIRIYPAQMGTQSLGRFRARITQRGMAPVENAAVTISLAAAPGNVIQQLTTDNSGLTGVIELPAPPLDYSQAPSTEQPYYDYTVNVTKQGFVPVTVQNVQVFPKTAAFQNATMTAETPTSQPELFVIPPHTLFGDFPPKIAENEIKPVSETGAIVLQKVVIPEYVVVHDGPPTDTSAANYYVLFRDYIKNVASSEIYSTWSEATITANVLAILSFTLNRVFTEWYRNQGFNFTVTSSTAFDHKWVSGRNFFDNISAIVDQFFTNYLSRPNVKQPILTQYCDGQKVQCPNWMTQWGSKELGDQGMSAIDILKHFYGDSIYINTAPQVSGVPVSWPGSNLEIGSSGDSVRMIQDQLNHISDTYPAVPKVAVDGQFTQKTSDSVKAFQKIFDLPQTGVVDKTTWYKISQIYVAATRIAEIKQQSIWF